MYEYIIYVAFALLALGVLALFAYSVLNIAHHPNSNVENASVGGVVLIGPIPLVFGSDNNSLVFAEVLALILTLLAILLYLLAKR